MKSLTVVFRIAIALVALQVCNSPATEPIAAAPVLKAIRRDLPVGWNAEMDQATIVVSSPTMLLAPSRATGLPLGRKNQPFEMRLKVGERISADEQRQRTQSQPVMKSKSDVIPYAWLPDFFGESYAIEVDFPIYVPVKEEDRQQVNAIYVRISAQWKAYPASRHADSSYYMSLLKLGSD